MDIYMLVESIHNLEEIKTLKVQNEQNRVGKGNQIENINLDNILGALNGYGRIILFRVYGANPNDPEQCEIEAVQEGKIRQGAMEGYCRNFDAVEDGFVELGFFRHVGPLFMRGERKKKQLEKIKLVHTIRDTYLDETVLIRRNIPHIYVHHLRLNK